MTSRYSRRKIVLNNLERYEPFLERRHRVSIRHYGTYFRTKMDMDVLRSLDKKTHRWQASDKFFKLASVYYDNPELWWVIAEFNQKPTENHCLPGDLIYIPMPVDKVISAMEIY
tara:strand:+ start:1638 stop:1979 length:342 start_codon:yes stop_codon:yes gene_type:complete